MNNMYYTYYESPLGLLRIGGTDAYIGEISYMNDKSQMMYGEPGISDVIHECTEQLIEFFQGKRKEFTIPIHQIGTDFQQQVWNHLLQVTYGTTQSYADLSRSVGDVKAVRAVANANGKNKIAIIVPCHRIIGTDKSLTGYNGGLQRKKWLLQHEFRIKHGVQTLF